MSKKEMKVLEFIQRHVLLLGFIAVSIVAYMMRRAFFDIQTSDWQCFLSVWIGQLNEHDGLKGIGQEIGEYNVPYMLFLNIAAKTPFNDLYEVKNFSVLFDYLCAFGVVIGAYGIKKFYSLSGLIAWTIILISPVSFLNSGYWGQCDSIYTAFAVMSLFFLLKEKYPAVMVFSGIAVAFKLQAIFFIPVIVIYYFASKKMSIWNFLILPASYFICIFPAIIVGRGFKETLGIYLKQTDLYELLTMNCPNLYYLIRGDYGMFKKMGILFAAAALGTAALYFIYHKITSSKAYILLAFWSSAICTFLLPSMHERYSYMACVFGILWALINKKDWWIALGINVMTLLSWTPYLFAFNVVSFEYLSVANLIFISLLTFRLFTFKEKSIENEKDNAVCKAD